MVNLKREEEGEMSIEEILASIRRYVGEEPQNTAESASLNSKPEQFSYIPSRGEVDKTAEALFLKTILGPKDLSSFSILLI